MSIKGQGHPKGGLLFWSSNERLEPGSVVNEAPVGLQSRALSEPAGECETPPPAPKGPRQGSLYCCDGRGSKPR